jgi:serine O-acetyltransferase
MFATPRMHRTLRTLRQDVQAVRDRDPANRSALEVILCYPGVHAVWGHRVSRWLWNRGFELPARVSSTLTRWITGADIHPAATLGPGLFIDHAHGVVIGQTAEIGSDVTIYHGVTLGGTSLKRGKRHPTVGDRVTIGAGAKILGAIAIGDGSRIGANAVVVKPVPANSVVVGVPGQIVSRSQPRPAADRWDLDNSVLPDLVGVSLQSLLTRVGRLETLVDGHRAPARVSPSENGVWRGEDFSI